MWRHFLPIALLAATMTSAAAANRPFPATAKRGTMSPAIYPAIVINDQVRQMTPGARIWNSNNLIELPAALRGSDFIVNYTEDEHGNIDRVWMLDAEEAREPLSSQTNSSIR